jgi:hypothetical protein
MYLVFNSTQRTVLCCEEQKGSYMVYINSELERNGEEVFVIYFKVWARHLMSEIKKPQGPSVEGQFAMQYWIRCLPNMNQRPTSAPWNLVHFCDRTWFAGGERNTI